ncbi:Endoribonuclease L-PSP [Pyrrhoderma noxium]|uniref:Endoribonuclease L-PSP n=1 Tax=Pyrrhoderma noxium TaxID=2282107 RepID=A0A286UIG1_9AGAM|nr:Endoribonuclease L-PSP [Pyrrhoderma noxium]
MKVVYTPEAVPPLPVFSQATISRGYVYVSGTIGILHDLKTIVPGGVQAQTQQALENMQKVLKAAVYIQFFDKDKMPARTCVGVATLPLGADFEIECVAEIPDN